MSSLEERWRHVRARIERACEACDRDPASVQLVAVSKRHSEEAIRAAYALGQRDFGENYVQEMVRKAERLTDLRDLRWHFVGHLQRNKAKAVRLIVSELPTVDSRRLVAALGRAGGTTLRVGAQVNVAGEAGKSGCSVEELPDIVASIRAEPSLSLVSLMTIPPASSDPEAARPHFRRLAELARVHGVSGLSMGMSADLEVAIEEGATSVRIGTAIFGERSADAIG